MVSGCKWDSMCICNVYKPLAFGYISSKSPRCYDVNKSIDDANRQGNCQLCELLESILIGFSLENFRVMSYLNNVFEYDGG